jgi:hypothetical protein
METVMTLPDLISVWMLRDGMMLMDRNLTALGMRRMTIASFLAQDWRTMDTLPMRLVVSVVEAALMEKGVVVAAATGLQFGPFSIFTTLFVDGEADIFSSRHWQSWFYY